MNTFPNIIAGLFGLGGPELLLIFAVIMLLFGAKRLPELAKGLGKSIKEFKHASESDDDDQKSAAKSADKSEVTPPSSHGTN